MLRLEPEATPISGVFQLRRSVHRDTRGSFGRAFCAAELLAIGWMWPVAQVNISSTVSAGTVRGLHFQRPPFADMKVITCVRGEVWDVVVDLRAGSPTFLQWYAAPLSAVGGQSMLVPPGCAHGFQTLSDDVDLVYCHSAAYSPSAEDAVRFDDPLLNIPWPVPVRNVSDRDLAHPPIMPDFQPVVVA